MQTALEPFMQPGVQETKENILLSTLLSLLALAKGKVLAQKKKTTHKNEKSTGSNVLSGPFARSVPQAGCSHTDWLQPPDPAETYENRNKSHHEG